ncbi:hypothetical protein AY599_24865 [Leptolyngbya valderiana BDU 20041]|nr:hypothetical protein AY599_24865 [Leptolyngbya valderiana BDU 20041]
MNKTIILALLAATGAAAHADPITVTITGEVASSRITEGDLAAVSAGDITTVTFQVDSDEFFDVLPGDLRNYPVNNDSFLLDFGSVSTTIVSGTEAFFTLVDGFPVSDGFILSTSRTSPGGVPLQTTPYQLGFDLGYEGSTLDSLDIADALGLYEFAGLTRFNFTIWSIFPDNVAMEINFISIEIASDVCAADFDGDGELTLFDFLAFQNAFDAGEPAADFDGDGDLTLFDFLAFQNAFDAGCE